MNARQKAKKYKRMYETLLHRPVKFKIEQHKIDTFRFEQLFYPEEFVASENSDYLRKIIVNNIVQDLMNNLDEYIDYKTEFCSNINKYRFYGEIKIVNKRCG